MHVYDPQIAEHYAAYRPPIHRLIVDEVLPGQQFEAGLDVGCGTGYSAIALARKCDRVLAVDSSQAMLDRAASHPKITYVLGSGNDLPVRNNSVDLVTFAGVLSYLNPMETMGQLRRVCRSGVFVFPYDFEIILDDLMQILSLTEADGDDVYNHACNLSGHADISTLKQVSRIVELSVTEQQAAHILLSAKSRYDPLAAQFGSPDPFSFVVDKLNEKQWPGRLSARIFYSLHQLST